jgi:MFS family permease
VNRAKEGYPNAGTAWAGVAILLVAYVFSFIDRQILNLLVAPIRRDLGISDTQMSLLMGFSFALFYSVCGIPLGRLADSRSRRGLVAAGVFFWSLMTAGCGLAQRYWHLVLCRFGVGVGEATLSPSAYSLIADSFPKETRATAISVYSMGIYLGSGLAFLLGGVIIQFTAARGDAHLPLLGAVRPWQLIFFYLGGAGMLYSVAVLALREPARRGAGAGAGAPVREVARYLWANGPTVFYHNVGFAMLSFASYGSSAWVPTFFIRTHGWKAAHVGVVYGILVAVFGALGIVSGGRLADRLAGRGYTDATMRVGLFAAVAGFPFGVVFPLVGDANLAVALLALTVFFLSMPFGVAPAAIQEIMPNALRGQASALYLFVVNLLGLGLGPTAVALVTDHVFRDDQAVRYSLLAVTAAAKLVAVVLLALGLRPYRDSLERLHGWLPKPGPDPSPPEAPRGEAPQKTQAVQKDIRMIQEKKEE